MNVPADDPSAIDALHERGRRLIAAGNPLAALAVFKELVTLAPLQVAHWLSLAASLRMLGERTDELAALERALALDPMHLVVLLQKGSVLELMHKPRSAAAIYTHALQAAPMDRQLPGPIEAHLAHARKRVAENSAKLEAVIEGRLAAVSLGREQPGQVPPAADMAGERHRFDRCLDRLLGRRRIFTPEPTFMLFPYLMNFEFFPRELSPWLDDLEAATTAIRDEFLAVLQDDAEGIEPYVAYADGLPLNQWRELNRSRRWGAYFLWNQGRRSEAHLARCPRTAAALAALPQVDVPGRGPTAFFSVLEPRTKIPPHTGVTNTRLTGHLPLVVPAGCQFRVGGETRTWRAGIGWVFDDTIEHEAWNDSDSARAILIFDVWNPQLTALERELVRAATVAMAEYSDAEENPSGVAN